MVWQDPKTKMLQIKCKKDGTEIYCGRVETDGIWHTSQDPSLRWNGYIEFRGTMPTGKNRNDNYCAFPAWWLWAYNWPHNGEIDIIETKNGKPNIQMALHSTNAKGGNAQHPKGNWFYINSDLNVHPLTAGLQWHVRHDRIKLYYLFSWYDFNERKYVKKTVRQFLYPYTKDYWIFRNTLTGNGGGRGKGFFPIMNLAQGGDITGVKGDQCKWRCVKYGPQKMLVMSVKVYGY